MEQCSTWSRNISISSPSSAAASSWLTCKQWPIQHRHTGEGASAGTGNIPGWALHAAGVVALAVQPVSPFVTPPALPLSPTLPFGVNSRHADKFASCIFAHKRSSNAETTLRASNDRTLHARVLALYPHDHAISARACRASTWGSAMSSACDLGAPCRLRNCYPVPSDRPPHGRRARGGDSKVSRSMQYMHEANMSPGFENGAWGRRLSLQQYVGLVSEFSDCWQCALQFSLTYFNCSGVGSLYSNTSLARPSLDFRSCPPSDLCWDCVCVRV